MGKSGGDMKLMPWSKWTMAPSRGSFPDLSTGLVSSSVTRNMVSVPVTDPPVVYASIMSRSGNGVRARRAPTSVVLG